MFDFSMLAKIAELDVCVAEAAMVRAHKAYLDYSESRDKGISKMTEHDFMLFLEERNRLYMEYIYYTDVYRLFKVNYSCPQDIYIGKSLLVYV